MIRGICPRNRCSGKHECNHKKENIKKRQLTWSRYRYTKGTRWRESTRLETRDMQKETTSDSFNTMTKWRPMTEKMSASIWKGKCPPLKSLGKPIFQGRRGRSSDDWRGDNDRYLIMISVDITLSSSLIQETDGHVYPVVSPLHAEYFGLSSPPHMWWIIFGDREVLCRLI